MLNEWERRASAQNDNCRSSFRSKQHLEIISLEGKLMRHHKKRAELHYPKQIIKASLNIPFVYCAMEFYSNLAHYSCCIEKTTEKCRVNNIAILFTICYNVVVTQITKDA